MVMNIKIKDVLGPALSFLISLTGLKLLIHPVPFEVKNQLFA